MTTQKMLEEWLEILNDVSIFLEDHIACEADKDRIIQLDRVINGIYDMKKAQIIVLKRKLKIEKKD